MWPSCLDRGWFYLLDAGDVVLGDRFFCAYSYLAGLLQKGRDTLSVPTELDCS